MDMARKYFPPDFFHPLLERLADHGFTAIQLHFSENEGFRLESLRYPQILSTRFITRTELGEIIDHASDLGINVIPALDMPGHLAQVLSAFPHLRLADTEEGRRALDYSLPQARQLMVDLIDEFAPLFPGPSWHLGADEFIDFSRAAHTYPQLATYARKVAGTDHVADGFTAFINEMIEHLAGHGKTDIRVWNDGFYRSDAPHSLALHPAATVCYWTGWDRHMAPVSTFLERGHRIINATDRFYYVLPGPNSSYSVHPDPERITEIFHPGLFSDHAGRAQDYCPPPPELAGIYVCIWCDDPEAETPEQVLSGIDPLLAAVAATS
ncbi:MAG: family 20 glycosylhydrolase [Flaviflexus sp.]|nr:family 20 glycosylhydrolase [Flaviflexus sp.]